MVSSPTCTKGGGRERVGTSPDCCAIRSVRSACRHISNGRDEVYGGGCRQAQRDRDIAAAPKMLVNRVSL
eukprot:758871-Prorocentrum_minimum.AAC.1